MTIRIPVQLVAGSGIDARLRSMAARSGRAAGDAFQDAFDRQTRGLANIVQRNSASAFARTGQNLGQNLGRGVDRGAASGISSFGQLSFSLSKVAGAFTGILGLVTPLGTGLVGAAAGATALAAAIGQASGVALSAGGIMASLGLAVGTVRIGLIGMGDAVSSAVTAQVELARTGEVSAESQEALATALEGVAPRARGLVTAIAAITPAWVRVQQAVQGSLLADLGGPLQQISNTYLPVLRQALVGTADDLNATARGWADMLTSAGAVQTVSDILFGLQTTLVAILPAVGNFASGFGALFAGSVSSSASLAANIVEISESFEGWAKGVTESGRLQTFLAGAQQAAGDLFGIIGNLGGTLAAVFSAGAATGRGLLSTLNDQTQALQDLVNSAAGQDALAAFFSTTAVAGQVFTDVLSLLGPILRGVTDVLTAIQPGLNSLREALLPVAQVIAQDLGAALSALAPVLGVALQGFAALVTAISPLAPVLVPLAAGIFLATKAWAAYRAIAATVAAVQLGLTAATYGTAGANVVAGQSARVYNAAMAVQRARTIATAAAQKIAAVSTAAFAAVQRGMLAVTNALSIAMIRQRIALIATAAAQKVVAVATRAWAAAQLLLSAAMNANPISLIIIAVIALGAALVLAYKKSETFRKIVDGAFRAIQNVAMPVIRWLGAQVPRVLAVISAAIRVNVRIWQTIFRVAWTVIRTVFRTAIRGIVGLVRIQFRIISTVVRTIINGITTTIRVGTRAVTGVFRNASTAWRGVFGNIRTALTDIVRNMWDRIKNQVTGGVESVRSAIAGLPGKIRNVGSDMYSAGKHLLGEVFDGIRAAASGTGSLVGSLASSIKSAINSALNLPLRVDFDKGPIHIHATVIPALAKGVTDFAGGLALVGEQGPELVELPAGSNVIPHGRSVGYSREIGSTDQSGTTVNQNFFGPTTSGGRLQELQWTLKYATSARREMFEGAAV